MLVVVFKENASKERCRLLWVSYGIFINLLPFLYGHQVVCLQSANKFCYDIAVSRVQYSILTETKTYFTWPTRESQLNGAIVSYSESSGVRLITQEALEADFSNPDAPKQDFDFLIWGSLQVGKSKIFQAYQDLTKFRMLIKNDDNVFIYKEVSPIPNYLRLHASSMCAVNAKFIFVTGGSQGFASDALANCHRYDIDKNIWHMMSRMQQARQYHSSCQLAGYIYVFCGWGSKRFKNTNSVEKLPIEDDNLQYSKQWQPIRKRNLVALPRLYSQISIALNSDEILIFGGAHYNKQKVQLFDTRSDTCTSVAVQGAFQQYVNLNPNNFPFAQSSNNKVVALVYNQTEKNKCFIQYVRETNTMTIL